MGFTKSSKPTSKFLPAPAGTHDGVLTFLYDCGSYDEAFNGKTRNKQQIIAVFELPSLPPVSLPETETKPARTLHQTINQWWNFSWNKDSNFRKALEGWRAKAMTDEECDKFDVAKLGGVGAKLFVIHETNKAGEIRAKIRSIMPLPKAQWPKPSQAPVVWSVDQLDSAEELEQLDLPGYVKDEVKKSDQYKALLRGAPPTSDNDGAGDPPIQQEHLVEDNEPAF